VLWTAVSVAVSIGSAAAPSLRVATLGVVAVGLAAVSVDGPEGLAGVGEAQAEIISSNHIQKKPTVYFIITSLAKGHKNHFKEQGECR
jgi:hypothetical protein